VPPYRAYAALLVVGLALVHLWLIGRWPLSADEAHYWEWSRRLDWSYYSKGPLVAYLIALGTRVGGHTEFGVRLPAVLLSSVLALMGYGLARRLFQSERAGFLAVLFLSAMPLYAVGAMLMTIDPPFVFCWALAGICLLRAVERDGQMAWYAAGAALGLGLVAKYTMLMLLPCVLLWLLASPRLRPWLARREPYEAAFIGLLLFSPVIVWNARYGWLSGRHVAGQVAGGTARGALASLAGGPEFFGSQLGVVSPLLFLVLVAGVAWAWREGRRPGREPLLLLACLSAPVFLFFQAWSFVAKVQANWAAHAYFTAAVAAAGWCESWAGRSSKPPRSRRRLNRFVLASILVPALLLPLGLFPGLGARLGLPLPAALDLVGKRLAGWPELGRAVGAAAAALPQPPFLVSDRYQIASQLAFYVPGHPRVYNANLGRRMNQYDIWGGWEGLGGRDGLFVSYDAGEPPPDLRAAFTAVERLAVVPVVHNGRRLHDFSIYLGRGFRGFPPRPFAGY
jgi:undecaprenyl-diphosphatase